MATVRIGDMRSGQRGAIKGHYRDRYFLQRLGPALCGHDDFIEYAIGGELTPACAIGRDCASKVSGDPHSPTAATNERATYLKEAGDFFLSTILPPGLSPGQNYFFVGHPRKLHDVSSRRPCSVVNGVWSGLSIRAPI